MSSIWKNGPRPPPPDPENSDPEVSDHEVSDPELPDLNVSDFEVSDIEKSAGKSSGTKNKTSTISLSAAERRRLLPLNQDSIESTLAQSKALAMDAEEDNRKKPVPSTFKGWKDAAAYFGYVSATELREVVESDLVKPIIDILMEKVVIPRRNRKNAAGQITGGKECNLTSVESSIKFSQSNGKARFSHFKPNFNTFTTIDFYAWAVYKIREMMTVHNKGFLYQKYHLTDHDRNALTWAILKLERFERSPSRVKLREERAEKKAIRAKKLALRARAKLLD